MRSQVLLCRGALPRRALRKGIGAVGRRGLGAKSLHTSLGASVFYESIREAGTLQVPQFAVAPVGHPALQMGPLSCLPIQTKNGEIILVGGPGTARNGGCGTVLVGTEGTGLLDGAHRNTVTRCRKKGDAWELLRGEMLNQHSPARPLRRQRLVVCNMPWGKGGSFSAYFPLHLCCLGVIGQSFLAEATPALHGSTKQEVLNTTGSTEGTLMWTQEHTTVGVGVVFPLTPMEPLGSLSWGFPPSLFPAPGWHLICPRQSRVGFSVGRMVT